MDTRNITAWIMGAIVVLALALGAWLLLGNKASHIANAQVTTQPSATTTNGGAGAGAGTSVNTGAGTSSTQRQTPTMPATGAGGDAATTYAILAATAVLAAGAAYAARRMQRS